jgi:CheY-like chemotaxis protein
MADEKTSSRTALLPMRELARRSVAGGLAQFMILVLALAVTSGLRDHPRIFFPIGVLMLMASLLRLLFDSWLATHDLGQHEYVEAGFRVGLVASAAAWGVFCCAMAVLTGGGPIFLLLLTLTALLSSAEISTLSSDLLLARWCMALLWAPLAVWGVVHGGFTGYSASAVVGFALSYLYLQINEQSRWFGRSLATQNALAEKTAELARKTTQLEDSVQRAEAISHAKSDLLASMGHEIRTPMSSIMGIAELLLETELCPEQQDLVRTVAQSADVLLVAVNDVLDLSKLEAGKLAIETADFDLRDLIEKTVQSLAADASRKNIQLEVAISSELPPSLKGDATRLHQIIWKQLSRVIESGKQPIVQLRVECAGSYGATLMLRFSVADPAAVKGPEQTHALDPAETSTADRRSVAEQDESELNLTVCNRLVKLMGGEIGLDGRPGRHTPFWFTLPFRLRSEKPLESNVDLSQVRVLVVQPSTATGKILESQLAGLGIRFTCAEDGKTALLALNSASEQGQPYDVVIVDQFLPDMMGLAFSQAVRARQRLDDLAVIVLAEGGLSLPEGELITAGCSASVPKPVRLRELRQCLYNALARKPKSFSAVQVRTKVVSQIRGRILLADDNRINVKVATRTLEKLGYYVDAVSNGREAVERMQLGLYDAVLMDCMMPEMDGYVAAREIRRQERGGDHVIIIAMSAGSVSDDRERCLAAGMDEYLAKPVRAEELQRTLVRHLERQRARVDAGPNSDSETHLGMRLKQLEQEIGFSTVQEIASNFLAESARCVESLQRISLTPESPIALRMLQTLSGASANIGATQFAEMSARVQLAAKNCLQQDYDELLLQLIEAQRCLAAEIQAAYPARRGDLSTLALATCAAEGKTVMTFMQAQDHAGSMTVADPGPSL